VTADAPTGATSLPATVRDLIAENQRLADELDRLHDTKAEDYVNATTGIQGMDVKDGTVELRVSMARELTLRMLLAVRTMLDESGPHPAENYVEQTADVPDEEPGRIGIGPLVDREDFTRYAITFQRVGKLTPHEARRAAEAERDALQGRIQAGWAELHRAAGALGVLSEHWDAPDADDATRKHAVAIAWEAMAGAAEAIDRDAEQSARLGALAEQWASRWNTPR
jgi:hypothetical protein